MGDAVAAGSGPVGEFCADLRQLRQDSGWDLVTLARELKVSRTQLYAILNGDIKRPPDWTRVVGPLVEACTGGNARTVAEWRRRHAVLVGVCEELNRRNHRDGPAGSAARDQADAVARSSAPAGGPPAPGVAAGSVAAGLVAATRTLPRDIASFTGRGPELRELADAAAGGGRSGGVVGIQAIGGMAGIGKTAFAVHAAHQLAPGFPDGQIFLPLHGHTPGHRPADPADALASLLVTAGVSARQIPAGVEARGALWRDRLAGRRVILVLDDAANSEQVRPLLPGTGGSLVLVTSRRHLTALEDATAITLGTLPPEQAAALLVRLADRPGLSPQDPAVGDIARLCGYLPLAVGMLARQLNHHPAWTPAGLATDLAAARDRLQLMVTENLSVAAAFDLSYDDLTREQQQLFRRLGLHPGADIDAYAAAALDGTELAAARRCLAALYDQYLLTEPIQGRYRLHDLIREHAHGLTARDDPGRDRDQAAGRLLDYYQHTAETADRRLTRYTRPAPQQPATALPATAPLTADAGSPVGAPDLPDRKQALSWARAERANLLACLDQATRAGQHARVVALTAAIAALLRHDGPWTDAITRHTTAVQAAQQVGDLLGQANALNDLGAMRRLKGDYRDAARALTAALDICRDLGDRLVEANALNNLGAVQRQTADYGDAASAQDTALRIYRELGDRLGQANALNEAGAVQYQTGDYRDAARAEEAALSIYRELGDRLGQANALYFLGAVRRQTGDYRRAAGAQESALRIYRELGDRLGQANTLSLLGGVRQQTGDYRRAARAQQAALGIYRQLGQQLGEATALNRLGVLQRLTGDFPAATEAHTAARGIFRRLGERGGEVETLNELGTLHRVIGDLDLAGAFHRHALRLAREIDGGWDEASALAGLGRCALAAGATADARASLQQAQEIFHRIGAAEATGIAAELDALATDQPVHVRILKGFRDPPP
jgi:tetratricopeptide (TPR) repeat protein